MGKEIKGRKYLEFCQEKMKCKSNFDSEKGNI